MACGIYAIANKKNNKVYVGSSKDVGVRWSFHRRHLRAGTHYNEHLQSAWDLYGEESFEHRLLEETESNEDTLLDAEQKWMDDLRSWDKAFGYNICPSAYRNVVSSETREKIGSRTRGKTYNELFGEQKAGEIKSVQARPYEEKYGKEKAEKLKASKRGSLVSRFGKAKAAEISAKMSKTRTGVCNMSLQGRASLKNSKLGANNPNFQSVPNEVVQSILAEYNGVITSDMTKRYGLSRYKIKQVIEEDSRGGCQAGNSNQE